MQGTYTPTSPAKKDINQKDLKDSLADGLGEDDEESMDWWTKYFASVDLMIKVGKLWKIWELSKVATKLIDVTISSFESLNIPSNYHILSIHTVFVLIINQY